MYKLMIVDDEQIEREGMAQFISWEKYDIELSGTAWNGLDAYEQIQVNQPDIVLTDMKMPVMNGIELIKRLSENFPDIRVIVLSGYGEYEYTSQAMEYGIRHYILKPCDEDKIVSVLEEVKQEIEEQRKKDQQERELYTIHRQVLPHAKEEIFRRLLLKGKFSKEEEELVRQDLDNNGIKIRLLAMKNKAVGFEYLEQFILGNILGEILGMEKMPLFTSIDDIVVFLLEDIEEQKLKNAVEKTLKEFSRMKTKNIIAAASRAGNFEQISGLYEQAKYLYTLSENTKYAHYLNYSNRSDSVEDSTYYFDFRRIKNAADYHEIIFEITLALKKMEWRKCSVKQKNQIACIFMLNWDVSKEEKIKPESGENRTEEELVALLSERCAEQLDIFRQDKEWKRMKDILNAIYQNIGNTELNIQYLAKEILFMNEDYFGRLFVKMMQIKFSTYLEMVRIRMAMRLLAFAPDMKISELTELVGYPTDGQYFSKAFRKVCGETPSEYREKLKKERV